MLNILMPFFKLNAKLFPISTEILPHIMAINERDRRHPHARWRIRYPVLRVLQHAYLLLLSLRLALLSYVSVNSSGQSVLDNW